MGDVAEGPAMDEGGIVLERLNEVRGDGVFEECRHRSRRLYIGGAHRFTLARLPDNDIAETLPKVLRVRRQTEDRHYLRGRNNVEPVLPRKAVGNPAEGGDDRAQGSVIHVDRAAPADPARIDNGIEPVIDVIIYHRGEQIVRRTDRVKVASKMKVDVLHWHDLRITAACRSALDAKARAKAGLAQTKDRVLTDQVECIAEPYCGRRLALARWGRCDRGDEDQLGRWAVGERADVVERDFGLVPTVGRNSIVW